MAEEHVPDGSMSESTTRTERRARSARHRFSNDPPHDDNGSCSRCGGSWPCLGCLTSTPPYVRIFNSC